MEFFSDHAAISVSSESTWKAARSTRETGSMTTPVECVNEEVQTSMRADASVSVGSAEEARKSAMNMLQGVLVGEKKDVKRGTPGEGKYADSAGEWNFSSGVASAVLSVAPMIEEALEENSSGDLYDGNIEGATNEDAECECMHVMSWPELRASKSSMHVTCMDWNSTGSVIAASYGRLDTSGWSSEERAGIALFSVFSRDFDGETPTATLDAPCPLMCLSWHPEKPSVIAAGSSNGEIMVWDTARSDDDLLVCASRINDYFHREPVMSLSWAWDNRSMMYLLVSVSGDGKVLFWDLKNSLMYPIRGHMLAGKSRRSGKTPLADGATSLSFQGGGKHAASFVVGTESGKVFRCFMQERQHASTKVGSAWSTEASALLAPLKKSSADAVRKHVEDYHRSTGGASGKGNKEILPEDVVASLPPKHIIFPSAVDVTYDAHTGPVHAVACSPFSRNVFLTCGADGNVSLYDMLQTKALHVVNPSGTYILAATWSMKRPLVFAAASDDGSVYIFDLGQSTARPVIRLGAAKAGDVVTEEARAGGSSTPPATALAFNPRHRTLLATANARGDVRLWKMNASLSSARDGEVQILNASLGLGS